jgi:hypothetical protein
LWTYRIRIKSPLEECFPNGNEACIRLRFCGAFYCYHLLPETHWDWTLLNSYKRLNYHDTMAMR